MKKHRAWNQFVQLRFAQIPYFYGVNFHWHIGTKKFIVSLSHTKNKVR